MLAGDYDAVLDYDREQSNNLKVCHNRSKEDTLGLFRDRDKDCLEVVY